MKEFEVDYNYNLIEEEAEAFDREYDMQHSSQIDESRTLTVYSDEVIRL